MSVPLFEQVILTRDLPERGLKAGDVGVVVEHYAAFEDVPEGYELEFFTVTGETIAVVSVPATAVRLPTESDVVAVRQAVRA